MPGKCSSLSTVTERENQSDVSPHARRAESRNINELFMMFTEYEVLTLVLQIAGLVLLVTTTAMFIKHSVLQKKQNAYQVCLLVSNAVLLLSDWSVFQRRNEPCDVFSLTFLVASSASTLSSLAIAWDRFRRMSRLFHSSPRNTQYIVGIIVIWILSLSTIALPLYGLIHSGRQKSDNALCFFNSGLLHSTFGPSLYFAIVSVIFPTFGMVLFYTGIYKSVRSARISRWINHASAEANRKAVLIRSNGRKANIVALPTPMQQSIRHLSRSTLQSRPQSTNDTNTNNLRERSIVSKAVMSVILVLCWYPFTGLWLMTSISGFTQSYVNNFERFILLAKLSSVLRIVHYLVLNSKFKEFYLKTLCSACQNRVQPINSRIEGNMDSDTPRNRRLSRLQCTGKTNLETIDEMCSSKK